jgi:hypothetical protein
MLYAVFTVFCLLSPVFFFVFPLETLALLHLNLLTIAAHLSMIVPVFCAGLYEVKDSETREIEES